MKKAFYVFLIIVFTGLASCTSSECKNINEVFENFDPESEEYKSELIKQMEAQEGLTYWFVGYLEDGDKELMKVKVKGENLCAIAMIEVKDWDKMEGIKEKKGISYHGAELSGLVFKPVRESGVTTFLFEDIASVID